MAESDNVFKLPNGGELNGETSVIVSPALPLSVVSKALRQIMRTPNLGVWGVDDDSKTTVLHSRNNQAGEAGRFTAEAIVGKLLGR